ncbi:MAG: hypothetical protein B7Y90_04745 [Alphaproteobacteria bacterium 32-64-14]|nr:MAG: hypothetical protein B7Y90_04745 [Alphaproteobacteria bacterium 32-64-14]
MNRLVLSVGLLALCACESGPEEVAAKTPIFVTDDCALIAAVGRDQYKLSRDDPPMSLRLQGEDAPWTPDCDWQSVGFNLVEVRGPEGEAATASFNKLTFARPRYDKLGALIRTSVTADGETTAALCRVVRGDAGWSLDSCGPDPKLTQPRPVAPSPADQTPEGRAPVPLDAPPDALRDAVIPTPDPGQSPIGRPG